MAFTIIVHFCTQPGKEADMSSLLIEASQTYSKDEGTLSWLVMQDAQDPTAWSIVERYKDESSFQMHMENPFYKKFRELVGPLVDTSKPTQILRHNELDSKTAL
ncbi:hypothetical protein B0H19DRAFT_1248074 [Mycena capillaripes]|nr:hypothetical protein B0H19DRAFT_1248074 [Mycena capillaripes]